MMWPKVQVINLFMKFFSLNAYHRPNIWCCRSWYVLDIDSEPNIDHPLSIEILFDCWLLSPLPNRTFLLPLKRHDATRITFNFVFDVLKTTSFRKERIKSSSSKCKKARVVDAYMVKFSLIHHSYIQVSSALGRFYRSKINFWFNM